MTERGPKSSIASWSWVLIAGIALMELVGHGLIRAAIPSDDDWTEAAAFVRANFVQGDRIVAAPAWTDPIMREHLGDLLSLSTAAASDLAGAKRVWELGIRGGSTPGTAPQLEEQFGEVRVRRWSVDAPRVLYDFVEQVASTEVTLVQGDTATLCPWRTLRAPHGGGLSLGAMAPEDRFVCDPRRPWLWVGPTVIADLDLQPRRCVWQHPVGIDPIRVTYRDVPIDERLIVHAGIYYTNERERLHAPVTLRVFLDEQEVSELVHQDGDGWARYAIDTTKFAGRPREVRFETTSENPYARSFCWAAQVQQGGAVAPADAVSGDAR